jgi:hypothetical protein
MPKEPVIQDKIHLLMEETGCDQGQAELAMSSAGYDLEKAIRTIGTLLRNIVVARGKFMAPSQHVYGLFILIADTKRRSLFRIRAVVSYNPALFETPLEEDWYEFERSLYAFRLYEGALQQVTQDMERVLQERLEKSEDLYDVLREGKTEALKERFEKILLAYFSNGPLELRLRCEELNLEEFRRFKREDIPLRPEAAESAGSESLLLNVDLEQGADGIPARDVRVGDSVYVLLTDSRDIAQYLSKLLGGSSERGLKPLSAPVEAARVEDSSVHFQIRLSSGILGQAQVSSATLLRVQKRAPSSWWRRLVPFSA